MDRLKTWLRDRWRGYTDADIFSYEKKLREAPSRPGAVICLTGGEWKASRSKHVWRVDKEMVEFGPCPLCHQWKRRH